MNKNIILTKKQGGIMKSKLFIISLLIIIGLRANAQFMPGDSVEPLTKFYLGIGGGANNFTGIIGISANYRIYEKLFFQAGVGLGGWGYKYTFGIRFDDTYGKGWSYGVGYSVASGITNEKLSMKEQSGNTNLDTLDLGKAATIDLKLTHIWLIHRTNTFYIEFGYAIPLQSNPWKPLGKTPLTDEDLTVLRTMSPGGIILGLGFTFGL
jgi:hypothetical protein